MMAGRKLEELLPPPLRFRIDLQPEHFPEGKHFETWEEVVREDQERAGGLQRAGQPLAEQQACNSLARKLARADEVVPDTLASKTYMREHRINCVGAVWQLAEDTAAAIWFVTLIPLGMSVAPDELANIDPRRLQQRLRMMLQRCGANPQADGWVFGYPDGEYNPETGLIQLHWHLIVVGEGMRKVVERLRGLKAFRSVRAASDSSDGVTQRVEVRNVASPRIPRAANYVVKSAWYSRWRGEAVDGQRISQKQKCRIPEPVASKTLLWLDRWRLGDMAVLINIRVGKDGLYRL